MYNSIYKEASLKKQEEIQMYIDLLDDVDISDSKYEKYYNILKSKFGIEHKRIDYQSYIDNPDLNNLKTKEDFLNFKLYVDYCKAVWRERKIIEFEHLRNYREPDRDKLKLLIRELNIELIITPNAGHSGHGDSTTIKLSEEYLTIYTILHELGHVYDHKNSLPLDLISKDMRYSPTIYGCTNSGETFAENFAFFFSHTNLLKKTFPKTYLELTKLINSKWKNLIKNYLL